MLKSGGKWAFRLFRGLTFVFVLLPAFIPLAWTYITSRRIVSARYGRRARNSLDIYLPAPPGELGAVPSAAGGRPVVVFFSGGMWTIGYECCLRSRRRRHVPFL